MYARLGYVRQREYGGVGVGCLCVYCGTDVCTLLPVCACFVCVLCVCHHDMLGMMSGCGVGQFTVSQTFIQEGQGEVCLRTRNFLRELFFTR